MSPDEIRRVDDLVQDVARVLVDDSGSYAGISSRAPLTSTVKV